MEQLADQSQSSSSSSPSPFSQAGLLPSPPPHLDLSPLQHIDPFLIEAVNSRNRITVLRLEREIERFARNPKQENILLKPMTSSYERLAAHRIAQYYGLQSMVLTALSPNVSRILLVKTPECRIPNIRLTDIPFENTCSEKFGPGEKIAIKQREIITVFDGNSIQNPSNQGRTPTKSMEEREEEYDKARARIFSDRNGLSSANKGDETSDPVFLQKAELQPSEHFSTQGSRSPGSGDEKILSTNTSRVAIFRDREKDMKDPDYDRSYSRYLKQPWMQSGFYGVMQGLHNSAGNSQEEYMQVNRPWTQQPVKNLEVQQLWVPWMASGYQNVLNNHFIQSQPNALTQRPSFAPQYGYMSGTFQHSFQPQLPQLPKLSAVGR